MKTHILLSLIFLFGILSGCAEHSSLQDTLDKAENFMENHPDSAYSLLQTVDSDALRTRGGRARYALLYTQAQDKNYIDETNDSLISVATNYYQHHGDVRNRFLSLYYKGRVNYNAGDYLHAMLNYSEAETLVPDLQDDYYAGLLYSQLGSIYRNYYDFPKSLEAYQKAEVYYKNAGKDYHRLFAMTDQSDVYRNLNEYNKSDSLLQTVLVEAERINNHSLIDYVLGNLTMQYVEQERIQEAKYIYEKLLNQYGVENKTSSFMVSVAKIHLHENDIHNAEQLLAEAWKRAGTSNDSIDCHLAASQLYKVKGQFANAMQEQEAGILMQNRIITKNLEQPILTIQRDYLSEKLKSESYRLYLERLLRILSVLFLLSLLLVVVVVFYRKLKKKKVTIDKLGKEKERVESENRSLLQQLEERKCESDRTIEKLKNEIIRKEKESNAEIAELLKKIGRGESTIENLEEKLMQKEEIRQEMETLVRKLEKDSEANAATISGLRVELETMQDEGRKTMLQKVDLLRYDLENVIGIVFLHEKQWRKSETKEKEIREKISSLKKAYFAGEDEYGKVEDLVNRYLDNVMVHFRKEVCLSSETDYRRVCYMFAGVSGLSIAQIMGESKEAVYQRRSRLLKKIAVLSCSHKEMFIMLLSKQL